MGGTENNNAHTLLLLSEQDGMYRPALEQLESIGVHVVQSPYRAVRDFCENPHDVVVANLGAFDESGLECISVFRDLTDRSFIVATYPRGNHELRMQALTQGADAVLAQPFYPRELTTLLRRGLSRLQTDQHIRDGTSEPDDLQRIVSGLSSAVEHTGETLQQALKNVPGLGEHASRKARMARETIRREADTLELMAEQLATLSRTSPDDREPVDIDTVVSRVLEDTAPLAHGINVQKNLEAAEPPVDVDAELVEKAFRYVLRGRLERVQTGGTVSIETERTEDGKVSLTIWDNGAPLSDEEQERLFDPFDGLRDADKRWALAFPIARRVARMHGGQFSLSSDSGQGTRVVFYFPVSPGEGGT